MLEHSFMALKTCIFIPNNFLYYHFALTWTLVFDLDVLENGTCENQDMDFSNLDELSLPIQKWKEDF